MIIGKGALSSVLTRFSVRETEATSLGKRSGPRKPPTRRPAASRKKTWAGPRCSWRGGTAFRSLWPRALRLCAATPRLRAEEENNLVRASRHRDQDRDPPRPIAVRPRPMRAGAVSTTAFFAMINQQGGGDGRARSNEISLDDAYSPRPEDGRGRSARLSKARQGEVLSWSIRRHRDNHWRWSKYINQERCDIVIGTGATVFSKIPSTIRGHEHGPALRSRRRKFTPGRIPVDPPTPDFGILVAERRPRPRRYSRLQTTGSATRRR